MPDLIFPRTSASRGAMVLDWGARRGRVQVLPFGAPCGLKRRGMGGSLGCFARSRRGQTLHPPRVPHRCSLGALWGLPASVDVPRVRHWSPPRSPPPSTPRVGPKRPCPRPRAPVTLGARDRYRWRNRRRIDWESVAMRGRGLLRAARSCGEAAAPADGVHGASSLHRGGPAGPGPSSLGLGAQRRAMASQRGESQRAPRVLRYSRAVVRRLYRAFAPLGTVQAR